MKKAVALLLALTLNVAFSEAKQREPKGKFRIINIKPHSVYFKVHRSFVGGMVEVYDANQMLLETDALPHTHTMVFFDEKPSGKYFIKVKKGKHTIEFGYVHI